MRSAMVTVFGGTGYLGTAIVRALLRRGSRVRIATRRGHSRTISDEAATLTAVRADVRDPTSVEAALAGTHATVNAVGLYVEKGADTFRSVHVEGAATLARIAARVGVERLVHVSGIGADTGSASPYVRARGEGERAVQEGFADAAIVRPSVLFGPGDRFLAAIDGISRVSPVFPLFGGGDTRMQPVYVDDVGEAVARIAGDPVAPPGVWELGGPRVLTYRQIIESVLGYRARRRALLPVPFAVWMLQARVLSLLPNPPLTVDQVILMDDDNVVGERVMTFADLGIVPRDLEALLPRCLGGALEPETLP